jgi:hypothetical protein
MTALTNAEIAMLQNIRAKADELARLVQEVNAAGFNIAMNMNFAAGACDQFDVHKMVKVDLRGSAN